MIVEAFWNGLSLTADVTDGEWTTSNAKVDDGGQAFEKTDFYDFLVEEGVIADDDETSLVNVETAIEGMRVKYAQEWADAITEAYDEARYGD